MRGKPQLILFVAGRRHRHVIDVLMRLAGEVLGESAKVQVIDVLRDPDAAEAHNILATPTLVASEGSESRRLIGDFSDTNMVAAWLRSANPHRL